MVEHNQTITIHSMAKSHFLRARMRFSAYPIRMRFIVVVFICVVDEMDTDTNQEKAERHKKNRAIKEDQTLEQGRFLRSELLMRKRYNDCIDNSEKKAFRVGLQSV